MEDVTYYTPDELRSSVADDDEKARTTFIAEAAETLVGGFYHNGKGDEWIVRRLEAPGVYVVTGSDFPRRYEDGLIYDEHITPLLMDAYVEGMHAKFAELGQGEPGPMGEYFLSGMRTTVCQAWCHPGRAHKVNQMSIDDDEWNAVREIIARAKQAA